jgi:hypothetical protein
MNYEIPTSAFFLHDGSTGVYSFKKLPLLTKERAGKRFPKKITLYVS